MGLIVRPGCQMCIAESSRYWIKEAALRATSPGTARAGLRPGADPALRAGRSSGGMPLPKPPVIGRQAVSDDPAASAAFADPRLPHGS